MAGTDIQRYGDDAMYQAQPMKKSGLGRITPQVTLLTATPDPLGAIAAGMRMFRGDPPYSLSEVMDEERNWAWAELLKTHLQAPLEFVDFQFMIEAVTRSFTHQMVRQRVGAVYAQESLRFAVKEGLANEVALPPSIGSYDPDDVELTGPAAVWNETIRAIESGYERLVNAGIPAEDARGLLPHAVTTRIIYKTNLRGLIEHAGNRLCTQAQFEWRAVFMGIMEAIRNHSTMGVSSFDVINCERDDDWQFKIIGTPRAETFSPVCYKTGCCVFMSELDRGCTIRDRVNTFSEAGIPPREWHADQFIQTAADHEHSVSSIPGIDPAEWMADPMAGVTDNNVNKRPEQS